MKTYLPFFEGFYESRWTPDDYLEYNCTNENERPYDWERDVFDYAAYKDAIEDPENIWCECPEDHDTEFKPDNESYLGVTKHGYICKNCKKYVQIG